jgi:hypothetical protein
MVLAAAGLLAGALTGCDDSGDNGMGPASEGPIRVSTIIVNPKSPAPGDTIQLTAVITSDSLNVGIFPAVTWSANDGIFLESNQTSVRWVAPTMSTLVTVSVTATTSINSAKASTPVFVGASSSIIASGAGQPFLTGATPDQFYFLTETATGAFDIYEYSSGSIVDATDPPMDRPDATTGENLVIATSLTAAAFQLDEEPDGNILEPTNVFYSDLTTGATTQITFDKSPDSDDRKERYYNPAVSNDGNIIAYQGQLPTEAYTTEVDSFDLFAYYPQTMTTVNLTSGHDNPRRNNLPTFSSDDNWLLFISDRTVSGGARWEYYALPISGGEVDTAQTSVVQVTNSNSQIARVSQGVVSAPLQSWNPFAPVLALVMTNGNLMQITMGPQGGTTAVTPLLTSPRRLVWAPDGSMLSFSDGTSLYTVPTGGTGATLIHSAATGDQLDDPAWSADMSLVVYRITRGSTSWFELKEAGDPEGTAVVITPSVAPGTASSYRSAMSLSPIWLPTNELMLLQFHGDTPGIDLLDISAAIQ